ncbi:MAG TPA: hypothetical protein VEI46_11060 [Thermodesulfovibrionales bacterium]|nr:hypothetical protein [Thermodesulfovibrionales bacterium]
MKSSALILFVALYAAALSGGASRLVANDDPCGTSGITVRNATMLDLWYKKNDGACSIWIHEHLFTIKPKDAIKIYSDMDCKTPYCPGNPSYKDYKSLDENADCGVKILPGCNLSDM